MFDTDLLVNESGFAKSGSAHVKKLVFKKMTLVV
jgi:hypothetical protein